MPTALILRLRHAHGSSPPDGRKIIQDVALSTQICAASTRSVPRAPRSVPRARPWRSLPRFTCVRELLCARPRVMVTVRTGVAREVAYSPQPGHIPGGSGRSPGVAVGVGCGLLGATDRVVRSGRWGIYECWSLVTRLAHWVSSQVARVVGMALSKYQVQKARRAGTSVSSRGCQFRAPAAALAQL